MADRVMYVEEKFGERRAWIGHVSFSRTWQTAYYRGRTLHRGERSPGSNFFDAETIQGYWISGPKRDGEDRHPAEWPGPVEVDGDVADLYRAWRSGEGDLELSGR